MNVVSDKAVSQVLVLALCVNVFVGCGSQPEPSSITYGDSSADQTTGAVEPTPNSAIPDSNGPPSLKAAGEPKTQLPVFEGETPPPSLSPPEDATPPEDSAESEIAGFWRIEKMEPNKPGSKSSIGMIEVYSDRKYAQFDPSQQSSSSYFIQSVDLDTTKSPKHITLSSPRMAWPFLGIYKIEGDTLTTRIGFRKGVRPESFDAPVGVKYVAKRIEPPVPDAVVRDWDYTPERQERSVRGKLLAIGESVVLLQSEAGDFVLVKLADLSNSDKAHLETMFALELAEPEVEPVDPQITEAVLKQLKSAIPFESAVERGDDGRVTYLFLNSNELKDDDFAAMAKLVHLKRLYIDTFGYSDDGSPITASQLAHLSSLKLLDRLQLKAQRIEADAFPHLADLPSLTTLEISSGSEAKEQILLSEAVWSRIGKIKKLRELLVNFSRIEPAGLEHLSQLQKLSTLTFFKCQGLVLNTETAHSLASIEALTDLNVFVEQASKDDLLQFATIKQVRHLRVDVKRGVELSQADLETVKRTLAEELPDTTIQLDVSQLSSEPESSSEKGQPSDNRSTNATSTAKPSDNLPKEGTPQREETAGSVRKWTDSTGANTVEAAFVEFKDGKVGLRKEDGKVIEVPIDRLAIADQRFVRSLLARQSNKNSSKSPENKQSENTPPSKARPANLTNIAPTLLRKFSRAQDSRSLAFSPDGRTFLVGRFDASMMLLDVESGVDRAAGVSGLKTSFGAAYFPDGDRIAVGGSKGGGDSEYVVRVVDVKERSVIREFTGLDALILCVDVSSKGDLVAASDIDEHVKVWNVSTGRLVHSFDGSDGGDRVSFSPVGDKLAIGAGSVGKLLIRDVRTGKLIHDLNAKDDEDAVKVGCLSFAPNGRDLLIGSSNPLVRLWDTRAGRLTRKLKGHKDEISAVTVSPNGIIAASAGSDLRTGDTQITLWNLKTGKEIVSFQPSPTAFDIVHCLAFSPDGSLLASGAEYSIQIWSLVGDSATGPQR